MAYIKS